MQPPPPHDSPLANLVERLPERPRLGSRALFPHLEAPVYLNHAAISPASVATQTAVAAFLMDSARVGVGAVMPWVGQRERLRARLATLIGARPDDIALTSGTTAGIQAIALGHPWQDGDGVVLFEGEFPANITPWLQAAKQHNLIPHFVPLAPFEAGDLDRGLAAVQSALEQGAALVAVSAVQFQTGLRMPLQALGELCHRYGAALFVDAIQACGAVPIDVDTEHIDYLASGGHKWLMGLEGSGFLYVAPNRAPALRPVLASWLSHEDALDFLFFGPGHLHYDRPIRKRADFIEGSAPQTTLFAALEAGLALIQDIGLHDVFTHIQAWHDAVEPGLIARGFDSLRARSAAARSASLCTLVPEDIDPVAFHAALSKRGIATSLPDGRLRMAPHWPNALTEASVVLSAVDDVLAELRRG